MSDLTIRRAVPADAETLSELGRDTFTETFGHLYPPEDLAAFLDGYHTPEAYLHYLRRDDCRLWIAKRDGRAVGYVLAGSCDLPHAEVTPQCGELKRIYVRKSEQGSGLGGKLLTTALDWLHKPGRRLWIGVWSGNHGAQRLYQRHGFAKVGEYLFPVGETRDQEFILMRD